MDLKNLAIIRQQFAQCVFNHKIHEKAADRISKYCGYIKISNIIVWCISFLLLILWFISPNIRYLSYIASWIAIFEIMFSFIQKEFPFEDMVQNHKNIAIQYLWLRDKYKNLIADIMNNSIKAEIISERRNQLQEQYQIICSLSPNTAWKDYKNTQLVLLWKEKTDEEFTRSEKEINRFLPNNLHI